jgi:DNA-directed RNA polymerase specialized sigma24 family protein
VDDPIGCTLGGGQAFEVLVERHQPTVYAVAQRELEDYGVADEATLRTFIRGVARLRTVRRATNFQAWRHRIVMKECRDIVHAQRCHVALDSTPDAQLASVVACLFNHPLFAGFAGAEERTESSATTRLRHALRRLQRRLGRPV